MTTKISLRRLVSSGESIVRITVRDASLGLDVDPVDLSIREARELAAMLEYVCESTETKPATVRTTVEHVKGSGRLIYRVGQTWRAGSGARRRWRIVAIDADRERAAIQCENGAVETASLTLMVPENGWELIANVDVP